MRRTERYSVLEETCTFVIPARDEAERLPRVLEQIAKGFSGRVIVVDNGSADNTSAVARGAGAAVIGETQIGKGYAVSAAVELVRTPWIFLCDADIDGFDIQRVAELHIRTTASGPLGRLAICRPPQCAPVTSLLATPMLRALGGPDVSEPLGGLALVKADFLRAIHAPGGWGFDVGMTLAAISSGYTPTEVLAPEITHRGKALADYIPMADEVADAIAKCFDLAPWDHVDCICKRRLHL